MGDGMKRLILVAALATKAGFTCSLIGACVLVGLSALSAADDKGFVRVTPDELQWKDFPNSHGAQVATLVGYDKARRLRTAGQIPAARHGSSPLAS